MSFRFPSFSRITDHAVFGHNETDADGNPAGGYALDQQTSSRPPRMQIYFQDGPVNREAGEGANGVFVEDLIEVAKIRLQFYQESAFACAENAEAIEHLKSAILALTRRRDDREARGVQGQHKA